MKRINLVIVVLLLIIVGAAAATLFVIKKNSEEFQNEAKNDLLGSSEMSAVYTNLLGDEVNLEDFVGNILVINSWASWSPQSQAELLILQKLAVEYSEKPVVFIAINRKESKEQAGRFMSTLPEVANVTVLIDTTDHFYSAVGGYAMPETIVYRPDGTTSTHIRGMFSEDQLRTTISESLVN